MKLFSGLVMLFAAASSSGWIKGAKSHDSLQYDFYSQLCPNAEAIALQTLQSSLFLDITAPAALLRLAFHDCQVQGCDASVLLQSTPTLQSEMDSDKNFGVRRLDFIDRIKTALESACPATVSCADIIVMAGRDSIAVSGGPNIRIKTGRRDGLLSSNIRADDDLPSPLINVDGLLNIFQPKGLSIEESVAIIGGGHSLGIGHCVSFINRLYPVVDSTMNSFVGNTLQVLCPNPSIYKVSNVTFFNNDLTNVIFDNQYFRDLQGGRGLLTIDSEISKDPRTQGIVKSLAANQNLFFQTFASAFEKLTSWQVLTGTDGEIRRDCKFAN